MTPGGLWDVATLGEEQGVKPGTYIVDSKMEPLALVIDDYAENMLVAGPALLACLKELVARRDAATVNRPQNRDGEDGRYARARKAIADAERGL